MKNEWRNHIQEYIERHRLLQPGDRVLVAVSGGPDSMALLHLLHQMKLHYGLTLMAAHYNHRLRADESDADEEFVREQARLLGITLHAGFDDGMLRKETGNLEERARERRYSFLRSAAFECGAAKIAVGHTADDQVETLVLWLARGAGLRGLGGMRPKHGMLIRPLLELAREEILQFLREEGIPWVEDSSNKKGAFRRNRVRRTLIPLLKKELGSHLVEVANRTMEILREEDAWMEDVSATVYQQLKDDDSAFDGAWFPVSGFCGLPAALQRRVVRLAIEQERGSLRAIGFRHVESVRLLAASGAAHGAVFLPGGCVARKRYERFGISSEGSRPEAFYYEVAVLPSLLEIPEIGRSVRFKVTEGRSITDPANRMRASLDAGAVTLPLIVRSPKDGDRFQPLGMRGEKKLSDFFIDRKVPYDTRRLIPIVASGGRIAWIAGHRIDDRFKVTERTAKTLVLGIE